MKNCVVIFNPASGRRRFKDKLGQIVSKLSLGYDKVDVVATAKRGEAEKVASKVCKTADTIVVIGGDGTISEVVNGIALQSKRASIGIIPAGTCNDIAHSLGLPKNLNKLLNIILKGKTFAHDIFKANERYGVYELSIGFFTETSYNTSPKLKKHLGRVAYFCQGCKNMFSSQSLDGKLCYGVKKQNKKFSFFLVLNSKSVAGIKIDKHAKLNDGRVEALIIKSGERLSILKSAARVFSLFLIGLRSQGERLVLSEFSLDIDKNTPVNIDGELAFKGGFKFKVLQKRVNFFVP